MTIFYMKDVSQTYGVHVIFEKLSLELKLGERVGLVGRNGEGKTSLLHIIAGITEPASGTVGWKKGTTKGALEQQPDIIEDRSLQEQLKHVFSELVEKEKIMRQMEAQLQELTDSKALERCLEKYGTLQVEFAEKGGYEMDADIRRVSAGLGIQSLLSNKWNELSGGERTKAGLAMLLLTKPDLLLLDEPTNHLDLAATEWLTEWVNQYAGTVVIISHDRAFLDETVTRIVEMDGGELSFYETNYSGFVEEREQRLLLEFQQYQDQQKKLKKMRETIKRLKEWANRANPPNAGMHRQAKSMEKAMNRIERVKKPVMNRKQVQLDFEQGTRSGTDVIQLDSVSKQFSDRDVLKNINLTLSYQDRLAIVGENGAGKSTLFKLILEELQPDAGICKVGANVSIGYLSQHGLEGSGAQRVIDALRDHVVMTEGEARSELAKFLFYGQDVFKKVKSLSGGERMRLRMAQLIHNRHNLLLLDEPTNHLDIDSREVLEDALAEFEGTILCISHDRYFLNKLFPKTSWLENGRLTMYEGNYAYSRKKREEFSQ
ncbi:ribosomal protection-like ABC-F family protein [Alkalicoccobacillus gibsonii]|uniref:ribosomal protection-like ABC-F family protein n=1 Tax=Alkalicoccobacillus gibsonii TaxID=79881 RepID=UPI0019346C95|nr:ABC-F family ATP-binding cassette domain-containing protein [Alkalicoccobacillus gibsonii]MBM0065966.1 ABC-F family ATP-binding cassette domain-containing protein [Alkalicoccobacillus gibsonii]